MTQVRAKQGAKESVDLTQSRLRTQQRLHQLQEERMLKLRAWQQQQRRIDRQLQQSLGVSDTPRDLYPYPRAL